MFDSTTEEKLQMRFEGRADCHLEAATSWTEMRFWGIKSPPQMESSRPSTDLRPSSLRLSIASGVRLSARVVFLISRAVCLLPRLCSTCTRHTRGPGVSPCRRTTSDPDSHLGQEASKVSPHVGQHFFFLGLIFSPLLGLFILFSLSLLLLKPSALIKISLDSRTQRCNLRRLRTCWD